MTSQMPAKPVDRIEKQILLRAPSTRVWPAIMDAQQFAKWFQVELEAPFVEGKAIRGRHLNPAYETLAFQCVVERIDPQRYLAFRWHPNAVDPSVDYSREPMTLVEFTLEATGSETKFTIAESGFDQLPEARRASAFRASDSNWAERARNMDRLVTRNSSLRI
jgi:uncharacterized protein YndB with AHSA1/START domain